MTYRIDYTTDRLVEPLCEADLNWEPVSKQPGVDYASLMHVLALRDDLEVIDDGKGRYRVMNEGEVDPAADEDIVEAAVAWRAAESLSTFTGRSATTEQEALRRAIDYRLRLQRDGERRVA